MKTILAPVDFSAVTDPVLETATSLAEAYEGRLVLLNIVQPPMITSEYGAGLENVQEVMLVSERAAAKNLAALQDRLTTRGIPLQVVQLTGAPIPLILDQARQSAADFIVMGSHGHTALYDLIVGSTTHGVLKGAPCPVIILPRRK